MTSRESNIKFFEATAIREVPGVVFGNHKTYKFVQESQTLQICFSIQHSSQESDNISGKFAYIHKKFLQKMRCVISTKNSKIIKLPATTAAFTLYNAHTASGSQQKGENG